MGLESAVTLVSLLRHARDNGDIGGCLKVYEGLRKHRAAHIIRASLKNGRLWQLPNGPLQKERDRELLQSETPTAGFPNLLADPYFQNWLWGVEAHREADLAWEVYVKKQGGKIL